MVGSFRNGTTLKQWQAADTFQSREVGSKSEQAASRARSFDQILNAGVPIVGNGTHMPHAELDSIRLERYSGFNYNVRPMADLFNSIPSIFKHDTACGSLTTSDVAHPSQSCVSGGAHNTAIEKDVFQGDVVLAQAF